MGLVTITGNLSNHGLVVLAPEYEQRLWFKPNSGHLSGSSALDNARVWAVLKQDGSFTAELWSEPSDPRLWYTLCTDWLPLAQGTEPTEERARGYYEWPVKIYPDVGGEIGDLASIAAGVGLVYVSPAVSGTMQPVPRYQLALNPVSGNLYERKISW